MQQAAKDNDGIRYWDKRGKSFRIKDGQHLIRVELYPMNTRQIELLFQEHPFIAGKIEKYEAELSEQLERKEEREEDLKAAAATGMPRGNSVSDPAYQAAKEIIDRVLKKIDAIKRDIDEAENQQRLVGIFLEYLPASEAKIIELRLIGGKRWDEVGRGTRLSGSYCREKVKESLKELVKLVRENLR